MWLQGSLLDFGEAAGVLPGGGGDFPQDDDGVVTVERVRVRVRFATDIDRADALLRSVLTEAIPVDVYV